MVLMWMLGLAGMLVMHVLTDRETRNFLFLLAGATLLMWAVAGMPEKGQVHEGNLTWHSTALAAQGSVESLGL